VKDILGVVGDSSPIHSYGLLSRDAPHGYTVLPPLSPDRGPFFTPFFRGTPGGSLFQDTTPPTLPPGRRSSGFFLPYGLAIIVSHRTAFLTDVCTDSSALILFCRVALPPPTGSLHGPQLFWVICAPYGSHDSLPTTQLRLKFRFFLWFHPSYVFVRLNRPFVPAKPRVEEFVPHPRARPLPPSVPAPLRMSYMMSPVTVSPPHQFSWPR